MPESEDYLSRARFYELFIIVFGKPIPDAIRNNLEASENIRDKISHGMSWSPSDARIAMTKVIDFATEFNVLKLVFSHLLIYEDTRAAKSLLVSLLLDGFYEEWRIPKKNHN